jgi:threonine synthase
VGVYRCACGALGELNQPDPGVSAAVLRALFRARREARSGVDASGVWRFRELIMPEVDEADIVTRLEGNTRLYDCPRLAARLGLSFLGLKHEGENPTGSFKDRGMTVGVTRARQQGALAIACASTGNTSASLASYGAVSGIPAFVFIPAGKIARGKLVQTLAYGARVLEVEGNFDDAMRLLEESCEELGLFLLNSVNPWRIEGQKSIVFELMEQLDWSPPDWLVFPAGNLGNTSAFGKGLRELAALGLIDRIPRLVAVQASRASPFASFFEARKRQPGASFEAVEEPETVATAIRIGNPRSWEKAIREIEHSGGRVLSVDDEEIMAAKASIDRAGVGCEPASAAALAGVERLVAEGVIKEGERVVGVLTGHLLKDSDATLAWYGRGDDPRQPPVRVAATREAIAKVLAGEVG